MSNSKKEMLLKCKREENRKRMPNVAKVVDEARAIFGDVQVLYAYDYETGVKIGEAN